MPVRLRPLTPDAEVVPQAFPDHNSPAQVRLDCRSPFAGRLAVPAPEPLGAAALSGHISFTHDVEIPSVLPGIAPDRTPSGCAAGGSGRHA